jgi:hypothetical protein
MCRLGPDDDFVKVLISASSALRGGVGSSMLTMEGLLPGRRAMAPEIALGHAGWTDGRISTLSDAWVTTR